MKLTPLAGNSRSPVWIRSSYSTNDGPECIEVAALSGAVQVRDSKDAAGPRLAFGPAAWAGFVTYAVRS